MKKGFLKFAKEALIVLWLLALCVTAAMATLGGFNTAPPNDEVDPHFTGSPAESLSWQDITWMRGAQKNESDTNLPVLASPPLSPVHGQQFMHSKSGRKCVYEVRALANGQSVGRWRSSGECTDSRLCESGSKVGVLSRVLKEGETQTVTLPKSGSPFAFSAMAVSSQTSIQTSDGFIFVTVYLVRLDTDGETPLRSEFFCEGHNTSLPDADGKFYAYVNSTSQPFGSIDQSYLLMRRDDGKLFTTVLTEKGLYTFYLVATSTSGRWWEGLLLPAVFKIE